MLRRELSLSRNSIFHKINLSDSPFSISSFHRFIHNVRYPKKKSTCDEKILIETRNLFKHFLCVNFTFFPQKVNVAFYSTRHAREPRGSSWQLIWCAQNLHDDLRFGGNINWFSPAYPSPRTEVLNTYLHLSFLCELSQETYPKSRSNEDDEHDIIYFISQRKTTQKRIKFYRF